MVWVVHVHPGRCLLRDDAVDQGCVALVLCQEALQLAEYLDHVTLYLRYNDNLQTTEQWMYISLNNGILSYM